MYVVPPIIVFLAKSPLIQKYDISSLKVVFCGAAPLTEDTERDFETKIKTATIRQGRIVGIMYVYIRITTYVLM